MRTTDVLTVSDVAHRSGFAPSALRFYEREGLIRATRTSGNQRRYERNVLRRLAFIRAAQNVGLSLDEISRSTRRPCPTAARRPARTGRGSRTAGSTASTTRSRHCRDCATGWTAASAAAACRSNGVRSRIPADVAAADGPGAAYLPRVLRVMPAGRTPARR